MGRISKFTGSCLVAMLTASSPYDQRQAGIKRRCRKRVGTPLSDKQQRRAAVGRSNIATADVGWRWQEGGAKRYTDRPQVGLDRELMIGQRVPVGPVGCGKKGRRRCTRGTWSSRMGGR